MIYPRKLTQKLIKKIDSARITVLTGMRQTGKTTLMRQVFDSIKSENKVFLDLENPLNQKVFEETNFDNILLNLKEFGLNPDEKSYVFLDEIQIVPEISRAIKYLYDHRKIKFFLTGSSSFYLKNLFPESLAGRKIVYELFPLDFKEFLVFKKKEKKFFVDFSQKAKNKNKISFEIYKKLYEEYLAFGGFPGVVIENSKEGKKAVLEDIFKSYFEKDVKALADFKEIKKLRDLIILFSGRVGSKIEITKIASEIGVSRETVYSYLGFLEKTYFVFLIPSFSKNINGEVRKARKIYFCDTGLLNYLSRAVEGAIFENAIFQNLRDLGKVSYYEKYKGPEIDFILDGRIALEAKIRADSRDADKLRRTANNIRVKNYYLISKNYSEHPKSILAIDL